MGNIVQPEKKGGIGNFGGFYLSEYKELIDKMRWSYSRLSSFDTCKYSFYLNYIINDDDEYLSEGNFYAEVGSFMHEILAMIFGGELSQEEALQYYIDNFDENVLYEVKPATRQKTYELCENYLRDGDFSWIDDYEILGVEMEVEFKIKGYRFVCYIDLLLRDKRDGQIVLIDHKSAPYPFKKDGGIKRNSEKSFNHYKKQMYIYCYAIHEKYGTFPKVIAWNHFKDMGRFATIPFQKSEYDETLVWLEDTIHVIEEEEEFEPTLDYFFCKNICSFRASCEYITTAN